MVKTILLFLIGQINYKQYHPYFFDLLKQLIWPITIIFLVMLFRKEFAKLIGRVKSIQYPGGKTDFSPGGGENSISELEELKKQEKKNTRKVIADLASLLSRYQYVWCAWDDLSEFSYAVRFSDKYSGGALRYINDFYNELKSFTNKEKTSQHKTIETKLAELLNYLKNILPYQKKNEKLIVPAFSLPKYQQLFKDLLLSIREEVNKINH